MYKDFSAKYYQNNKERPQKTLSKISKFFYRRKRKRQQYIQERQKIY